MSRRRWSTWAALGAAAIVVGAVALGAARSDDDSDDRDATPTTSGSTSTSTSTTEAITPGEILAVTDAPDRYRVVHRLHDENGEVLSTEEVVVDRPYRSRRTLWDGAQTSGEPTRISVSDFGLLSVRAANSADLTLRTTVAGATGDLRLADALDELVESGRLVVRERSAVLGTECQVYRTGEPVGTGRLTEPTETEWTDICIDARGLLLSEDWYLSGRLFQSKVATEVEIDPPVDATDFAAFSAPLPVEQGGGDVREVDPQSRPDYTFWALDGAPPGLEHRGRYEVLIPSGASIPGQPDRVGSPHSEVVDVYETETDFFVIGRGSFVGREHEFAERPWGVGVDLGELGTGEIDVGVFGNWLRVKTDAVQFVSLRATVPSEQLVEVARRLEPRDRGRLVYLD